MSNKNELCDDQSQIRRLQKVVTIPNPLYDSIKGRYFVGQSIPLGKGTGRYAWAALVNPENSDKILSVNVFTISNFSPNSIVAEVWLNARLPGNPNTSMLVSAANTTLSPQPVPETLLEYVESTNRTPEGGVNIYGRIVPPSNTLVAEEDGKFFIPPGGNYAVFLRGINSRHINAVVAFGWSEKSIMD